MVEANDVDNMQQNARDHSSAVFAANAVPGAMKKSGAYPDPAFLAQIIAQDRLNADAK